MKKTMVTPLGACVRFYSVLALTNVSGAWEIAASLNLSLATQEVLYESCPELGVFKGLNG